MNIVTGELVTRKSYGSDLLFKVSEIDNKTAILHGKDVRLEADAPLDDLKVISKNELVRRQQTRKKQEEFSYRLFRQDYKLMREKSDYEISDGYKEEVKFFRLPIKVLHLDGDQTYLKKCIDLYKRLGLQIHGVYLNEKDMPLEISSLIKRIQPELVVITGHDAYSKNKGEIKDIRAYRNSSYFSETVREARKVEPNLDQLII